MNKKKAPKFLYRIYNQKYFLKLIESKSLYLSNPADFNDPYDCALGIDIEKLSEQEKKTVIKKHFQEKGIDLTEVQVRDKVKENEKKGWTIINEAARETSLELAKEMGVCCLTTDINSLPMWAHYGDKHEGVAVKFNTDYFSKYPDVWLFKVAYVNRFPTYNEWSKNMDLAKKGDQIPFAKMVFCRKSKQWASEKEWRLIRNKFLPKEDRHVAFEQGLIDAIYFGSKVSESYIAYIQGLIEGQISKEKQFQMKVDSSTFNLKPKQLL